MTYPAITKACQLIALDNGGINRTRPASKQNQDFSRWIASQDYPTISEIDAWLGELSGDDFETVCCGEAAEASAIMRAAPAFTGDLLNAYFDEVC